MNLPANRTDHAQSASPDTPRVVRMSNSIQTLDSVRNSHSPRSVCCASQPCPTVVCPPRDSNPEQTALEAAASAKLRQEGKRNALHRSREAPLTRCPPWESNPEPAGFRPAASTSCARRARRKVKQPLTRTNGGASPTGQLLLLRVRRQLGTQPVWRSTTLPVPV